jgi:hypothetical protein
VLSDAAKGGDALSDLGKLVDDARPRGAFAELLQTGRFTPDQLTQLARAGRLAANEISDVVMHLGVKTPRDQLVLWSGLGIKGEIRAAAYAREAGGMTLEMTKGGKWLDDLKLFDGGVPNINRDQARRLWEEASAEVAKQASGQVRVAHGQISPGSVFSRIERPILLDNPRVLGIDMIPLKPTIKAK